MSENLTHATQESDTYRSQIRKRLKKQQEFKQYLSVWLGVSVLVTVIWFITTPTGYFWPVWPIFGMGIGAFFQWREAYGEPPREITDADIDAEIQRIREQK
ncbi:MAG: 2TM domain-containing protein [Chloroflexota bacterium]|jgi:hypothetical protein